MLRQLRSQVNISELLIIARDTFCHFSATIRPRTPGPTISKSFWPTTLGSEISDPLSWDIPASRKHRKKKEELNNRNHLCELPDLEIIKKITQETLQVTALSTSQSIKIATYIHDMKLIIATSTTWHPSKPFNARVAWEDWIRPPNYCDVKLY